MNISELTPKGTLIRIGNEKRDFINDCVARLRVNEKFTEVQIPVINYEKTFSKKVGLENNNMMYTFKDKGGRELCLAPEYTAVVQQLAHTTFKQQKDVFLFYVAECFRGEKPQAGRYRQFTQLGVEILNPTIDYTDYLVAVASELVGYVTENFEVHMNCVRGLDYYQPESGFEISCPELGSSKQVCGGGAYDGGIGFALGIDRLLLLSK